MHLIFEELGQVEMLIADLAGFGKEVSQVKGLVVRPEVHGAEADQRHFVAVEKHEPGVDVHFVIFKR